MASAKVYSVAPASRLYVHVATYIFGLHACLCTCSHTSGLHDSSSTGVMGICSSLRIGPMASCRGSGSAIFMGCSPFTLVHLYACRDEQTRERHQKYNAAGIIL